MRKIVGRDLEAFDTVAATQADQEATDAALRTLLLDLHATSGQTRFGPAGEVRLIQTPIYVMDPPLNARAWNSSDP